MLLSVGTSRFVQSAIAFCVVSSLSVVHARSVHAGSPSEIFDEAVRLDLEGKAQVAFPLYMRAASAGLSQAQFDVAVMLDSGRGTPRDIAKAAIWYARAAAHGNQRAAYNLGQLYEEGEGVPQNPQMARAWFTASGLAASSAHLRGQAQDYDSVSLSAPSLIAPVADAEVLPEAGGIVLVWTSPPQPASIDFYIELRVVEASGSREIFSGSVKTSSIFASIPQSYGDYAWRVTAYCGSNKQYAASKWLKFSLRPKP